MGNGAADVMKPEADTLSTNWPKNNICCMAYATCFLSRCRFEEKETGKVAKGARTNAGYMQNQMT